MSQMRVFDVQKLSNSTKSTQVDIATEQYLYFVSVKGTFWTEPNSKMTPSSLVKKERFSLCEDRHVTYFSLLSMSDQISNSIFFSLSSLIQNYISSSLIFISFTSSSFSHFSYLHYFSLFYFSNLCIFLTVIFFLYLINWIFSLFQNSWKIFYTINQTRKDTSK
jgi:hypothetical protein